MEELQFNATVTSSYTIVVESTTYWSCKVEGNFKLSMYSGSGDAEIYIEIPNDIMTAEGAVYFSYGEERCNFPKLDVFLANLCYISTTPNYEICDEEKVIYFYYNEPGETFNVSVFCYDGWEIESSLEYITNNNEVMIITGNDEGEVKIIPKLCEGEKNIVHIKLQKKQADS